MPKLARSFVPALLASALLAALPALAVTVSEVGDAGQLPGSAQVTLGSAGALTDIFGSLSSSQDADLYLINITNPSAFSATTLNLGSGEPGMDTQLFLFTQAGAPVYVNDDDAGGLSLLSTLSAGAAFGPLSAGLYYLGITSSGYDPINSNGQLLFANGLSTETRGPAFGLQPATVGAYTGIGFSPVGAYDIQLTGAVVAAVPEVSSSLMFAMAGAMGAAGWLRRRRATACAATV